LVSRKKGKGREDEKGGRMAKRRRKRGSLFLF
jgi:hypothetical protein